jgi:mannose-6-phosphate isomerase class I
MKKHILLSLAGLLLTGQLCAYGAVTSGEIQAALERAKVLGAGTGMTVSVSRNQAVVGTYKNTKANEKDCKIDAVLIAKAIMDLAPNDIVSVSVYFYNRADLSMYEQVTLSAGDIKAFGSGDVGKEQFLSSVKLEHHEADDAARIANYIQAAQQRMNRRPAEAKLESGNVDVHVDMEPWVSGRDLQFEALRIAQNVLQAKPGQAVQKISIVFSDPSQQLGDRKVTVSTDDLQKIEQSVISTLASVSIAHSPARHTVDVSDGPHLDERRELAKRVVALKIVGADTAALEKDFYAMDQGLKTENDAKLKVRIKKLDDDITGQEKSSTAPALSTEIGSGKKISASENEIRAAIVKANILMPSSTMTVRVKPSEVVVATYKADIASDKDSKIDAILIAKTVMDLAPSDIASVTMYFYGRNDLSAYDEITLSAGDIKAFATGKLSKEQLLASIKLAHRKTEDVARIASSLEAQEGTATRHPAQVTFRGGTVDVGVQLESWVQDRDARYEALRIAEKVIEANRGKPIQSISIAFSDPDMQVGDRDITITPAQFAQLQPAIGSALAAMSISGAATALASTDVVEGPLKEKRLELFKRIQNFKAANVGVSSFMAFFQMIEQSAARRDEPACTDLCNKLSTVLDQQEKTIKAIKERANAVTKTASSGPAAPPVSGPHESRWAMGRPPIMDSRVLSDPDGYIVELATYVPRKDVDPGERLRYFKALRYFAQQLRANGKLDQAANFDRQVYDMRRRFPELNKL